MLTNALSQTFMTEIANDHPQLQRPKTAAKLNAVVRSAAHFVLLRRPQIFGHERKSAAQQIHLAAKQYREVKRREQPFVWVGHERIGPFAAIKNVLQLGNNSGRARV